MEQYYGGSKGSIWAKNILWPCLKLLKEIQASAKNVKIVVHLPL